MPDWSRDTERFEEFHEVPFVCLCLRLFLVIPWTGPRPLETQDFKRVMEDAERDQVTSPLADVLVQLASQGSVRTLGRTSDMQCLLALGRSSRNLANRNVVQTTLPWKACSGGLADRRHDGGGFGAK